MTVTEVADDWQVTALLKLIHLTFSLQTDPKRERRKFGVLQGSRKIQSNQFTFYKTNFFEYKGSL